MVSGLAPLAQWVNTSVLYTIRNQLLSIVILSSLIPGQSGISECKQGYTPLSCIACDQCQNFKRICSACSCCSNCRQPWCRHQEHVPNLVVAHTTCENYIDSADPQVKCGNVATDVPSVIKW